MQKKFVKFGILVFIQTLFTYMLYIPYHLWVFDYPNKSAAEQLLAAWYFSMNFVSSGPPAICAMFLTCKMLKNYYVKMEEKASLTKENAKAELQLLKAQIHPHFLFNTLNNIFSFALNKSSKAGNLVLKLSNTVKYMVNDCEAEFVPLEKELKMINDYVDLEKVRYGDRLGMQLEINGEYQNKMIAPLLMIPFVENCFKHGASVMRGHQWIKLIININNNRLDFDLSNSKPLQANRTKNKKGIGLANVEKRLRLLYPGKHFLNINSTDDTYSIHLQINLQEEYRLKRIEGFVPKFQPA